MNALLAALTLWLAVAFDLPEPAQMPHVRQLPAAQLAAIHFGRADAAGRDDVLGIYLPGTIALRNEWDARDPVQMSVLVHELVHHLQDRIEVVYACPQEREALAFEAQEAWLEMFGLDLESAFGIDGFALMLRTTCIPY